MKNTDLVFPASRNTDTDSGLTARDYIAIEMAKAIVTGLWSDNNNPSIANRAIVRDAYAIADELIDESNTPVPQI